MNQSKTLSGAIGERIRELREASGVRQEDVASSARRKGLPWTRATVASIETGKRRLTIEELTLLPFVLLSSRCHLPDQQGKFIQMYDLAPQEGWVAMAAQNNTHARVIGWVWRGQAGEASQQDIDSPEERELKKEIPTFLIAHRPQSSFEQLAAELNRQGVDEETFKRALRGAVSEVVTSLAEQRAEEEAASDASKKAARKLGVKALRIAEASRNLWGRSLAEERDRRISERVQGKESRTIQALRGHVTRSLLRELQSILKTKSKKPKGGKKYVEANEKRKTKKGGSSI